MANVMIAIKTEAASVTVRPEHRDQNLRRRQTSDQESQREPERQDIERSNLRHSLRDQVLHQPIPYAHFASDVQEQQQGAEP